MELEFEEAKRLHTLIAYKRFLEEFPDSHRTSAAPLLLEGLRFNAARSTGTAEAYRQFLKDYPEGSQRDEAKRLLARRKPRSSPLPATRTGSPWRSRPPA